MMACTLCKLVSGDNKIPLNTYADFIKKDVRKGSGGERGEYHWNDYTLSGLNCAGLLSIQLFIFNYFKMTI